MTSTQNEDELDKILYEFGNHVWKCAQNHSGWSQEGAQAALQSLIAKAERRTFNRLEVIDHTATGAGRNYVKWETEDFTVIEDVQDDGHTLKIFLAVHTPEDPEVGGGEK